MSGATPKAIVTKLNAALLDAMKDPDVVKRVETLGAEPLGSTPQPRREPRTGRASPSAGTS